MVAETYARIFFRNCISTGEMYPVETDVRLCDVITTGQEVRAARALRLLPTIRARRWLCSASLVGGEVGWIDRLPCEIRER